MLVHILIVDDDDDVREMLEAMLETSTYQISSVEGGAAMREFLSTNERIDLVVLDGDMAGETSASLALHLKDLHVRLVMISGSPRVMEFAKQHRLQLLVKPFRLGELDAAIRRAFESAKFGQRDA